MKEVIKDIWWRNLLIRYFQSIRGGADWFYSLPKHDNLCHSADKIFNDYKEAVKYGNIFSINVGPDYEGKIRDIDVKTLKEVGKMIEEYQRNNQ